jgi:hypothetical protein
MEKAYYDKFDIMARYDVSINIAMKIIREIKSLNGGGVLVKGKVLPSELSYWEINRGRKSQTA